MDVIRAALKEAGEDPDMFESLRIDASSPRLAERRLRGRARDLEVREVVMGAEEGSGEDTMPWVDERGHLIGTLCFKYAPAYVAGPLLTQYFEKEPGKIDQTLVVRVTNTAGGIVYETAHNQDKPFEVTRSMDNPTFKGLELALRHRDLSIREDIQRWKRWTYLFIGFIDLMLGAGLFLVYSNVRREMHLSRIKSDFVANVSHELKTPLALIRLFAETLELGRVPGELKAKQYYHVINKESQRLSQLIDNILDFSRIEAGKKEYRFAPIDLAQVVNEVLEAYRFQIEQQGFTLEVAVQEDLPEVSADKQALAQALLNLVNNAIKYSSDEKSLRLHVRREGDRLLVSVTDRGIGVPRAEHKKIFEKFYRAEDSLVHQTKGSGLGLPLVRHIMEAHGGWVEVESTPGKGSTFTLVLPLKSPATDASEARPESAKAAERAPGESSAAPARPA
jgi:signal transduction histidine kinase